MSWTSTQPAAYDALVTAFQASPDLTGVDVFDGGVVTAKTLKDVLVVGSGQGENAPSVEASVRKENLSLEPDREEYTISCLAEVVRGNPRLISEARTRAYQLLNAAVRALVADQTLGGLVMTARLGSVTLSQIQSAEGVVVDLVFGVEVSAYTTG